MAVRRRWRSGIGSATTGRQFDYESSSSSSDDEDDKNGSSLRPVAKSAIASRWESIGKPDEVDGNVEIYKSSATKSGAPVASTAAAAARPEICKAAPSLAAASSYN